MRQERVSKSMLDKHNTLQIKWGYVNMIVQCLQLIHRLLTQTHTYTTE